MVSLRATFHYFYMVHRNSHSYENLNVKLLHSYKQESNIYITSCGFVSYSSDRRFQVCIYALYVLYLKYVYTNAL